MTRIATQVLGILAALAIFIAMLTWGLMLSRGYPNVHPILIFGTLGILYTLIMLLGLSRWRR